jgi:hypothetical protein
VHQAQEMLVELGQTAVPVEAQAALITCRGTLAQHHEVGTDLLEHHLLVAVAVAALFAGHLQA